MVGVLPSWLYLETGRAICSLRHKSPPMDDNEVLAPGNHKSKWSFEIVVSPESNTPPILDAVSMIVLAYAISMLHNFLP